MIKLLSLALIALFGAMSPGPDFAIVTRYSITGSRRAAFLASLGIALALLVHMTYCALGVIIILFQFPFLFRIIQICGSCYLGYLGMRLLLPGKKGPYSYIPNPKYAFLAGFFSSLLNPKTTLFIFGIFTQFITPGTPWPILLLYSFIISGVSLAWLSFLIIIMTQSGFKNYFDRWQHVMTRGMGVVLIGIALAVFKEQFIL